VQTMQELANLQNIQLEQEIKCTQRDPNWTESVAVGQETYLLEFKRELVARGINKHALDNGGTWVLRDSL